MLDYNIMSKAKKAKKVQLEELHLHEEGQQEGLRLHKEGQQEVSEEEEKASNIEGKIQEEKKPSDETVFNANKEKAGEAEELEKNINLERKMLVFGHSAKVIAKTEEKKPPDLSKLNQNAKVEIG